MRVLELDALAVAHEVHEKHAADKSDSSEYTYGREVLDWVFPVYLKCVVSHRIGNGYGWHVESHAESVKRIENSEFQIRPSLRGIGPSVRESICLPRFLQVQA